MDQNPDFTFCSNNGVIAVCESANGRFAAMRETLADGSVKSWLFCNADGYTDDNGDFVPDIQRRGIRVGSIQDWRKWREDAQGAGATVQYRGAYVPCSNGTRLMGMTPDQRPVATFEVYELKLIRFDLPTAEQIQMELSEQDSPEHPFQDERAMHGR